MKKPYFPCLPLLAACLFFLNSCRDYVALTPAPMAQQTNEKSHAASASVADVKITVQGKAWKGNTAINSAVTPLLVSIENNSGYSVRLRYSDFALVGSNGQHFAALPPYAIEGSIEEPVVVHPSPGDAPPRFHHRGFMVAPYYAPYYGGIAPFDGPFFYDPFYYDRYYTYWQEVELPTIEMLQEALPDGVVEPGGMASGFLYFEEVTADVGKVNFRMDIADARSGKIMGNILIPFDVK